MESQPRRGYVYRHYRLVYHRQNYCSISDATYSHPTKLKSWNRLVESHLQRNARRCRCSSLICCNRIRMPVQVENTRCVPHLISSVSKSPRRSHPLTDPASLAELTHLLRIMKRRPHSFDVGRHVHEEERRSITSQLFAHQHGRKAVLLPCERASECVCVCACVRVRMRVRARAYMYACTYVQGKEKAIESHSE